jgi:hypothetical protein
MGVAQGKRHEGSCTIRRFCTEDDRKPLIMRTNIQEMEMFKTLFVAVLPVCVALTAAADTTQVAAQTAGTGLAQIGDVCTTHDGGTTTVQSCAALWAAVNVAMNACMGDGLDGHAGYRARYLICAVEIRAKYSVDR